MIERLRRSSRIAYFVLNETQSNETGQTPRLFRKHSIWGPERATRAIEGVINRFECVLRKKFAKFSKNCSSNLIMSHKSSLNHIRNQKGLKVMLIGKNLDQW